MESDRDIVIVDPVTQRALVPLDGLTDLYRQLGQADVVIETLREQLRAAQRELEITRSSRWSLFGRRAAPGQRTR